MMMTLSSSSSTSTARQVVQSCLPTLILTSAFDTLTPRNTEHGIPFPLDWIDLSLLWIPPVPVPTTRATPKAHSSNERKKKKRFWGNFLQKAQNISRQNAKRKERRRERGLDAVEGAESSSSLSYLLLFFSFFLFWLLASFDCYYYDSKGYITTGPANTHTHTHTADDDVTGLTSMPGAAWRIF
jgi:hypothetical protein